MFDDCVSVISLDKTPILDGGRRSWYIIQCKVMNMTSFLYNSHICACERQLHCDFQLCMQHAESKTNEHSLRTPDLLPSKFMVTYIDYFSIIYFFKCTGSSLFFYL